MFLRIAELLALWQVSPALALLLRQFIRHSAAVSQLKAATRPQEFDDKAAWWFYDC
jgi:hypothetical protein